MANSGSFSTNGYTGSTTRYLTFNWWVNSQSVTENYTEIGWELVGAGGNTGTFYKAGNFNVWIAGTNVYSSTTRIELYNGTRVASGTHKLWHDNVGNCYFEASAEAGIYYTAVNCTGSGGWNLPQIPRYTTVTNSTRGRTINTISVNWTTTDARDHTQYSLNGGAWTNAGDTVASDNKSGYYTISGLSANTKYTVKTRCKRADSQLWSEATSTLTITTYNIAYITEAPNFTDEENPTIKYSNPFGNSVTKLQACISLNGTKDDVAYRDISKTGTSYTFNLTDAERKVLRQAAKTNSLDLTFFVRTTYGKDYHSTVVKTMSIVNANPTFSNFTYQDTDSTILALTGNNQTIVKGYSNVKGIVSAANKATPKKEASMSKYRLSIGEKTAEVAYSSSAEVSTTISDINSNSFTIYAIDSRGNSTPKTITASKYISYTPIKITSISLVRTNSVTSETTLKFSGTIWDGSFGSVTNKIKTCTYRYKLSSASSWTTGATTITPTKSGSSFSFTGIIAGDLGANGFNINNSYNIQVLISDELSNNNNSPASFTLGPGTPAMAIHKNNVAIGQRYDTNDANTKFQVNGRGKFSQGTSIRLLRGGEQESSYMHVCRITINRTYSNQYMEFGVIQRGRRGKIFLQFATGDTKDPNVSSFFRTGNITAYIAKNTTSTWDLYLQKSEWYDDIEIIEFHKGSYMDTVSVQWKGLGVSALPSSYTTASRYKTKSLSSVSHANYGTNNDHYPDIAFISYWNGAYDSNNASNLKYCSKGGIRGDSYAQIVWGRQTVSCTSWEQRSFGTAASSMSGGRFTISGNNVVVGSGVTRVKVSVHSVGYHPGSGGDRVTYIKIGSEVHNVNYTSAGSSWGAGGSGTVIANVSQGTNITALMCSGLTQNIEHLGAWLVVEDLT